MSKKPANWLGGEGANLKHFVGGFAQVELIPSFAATTPYGTISINRWGMRDQDYARPSPATYRAALLGASGLMGWGVGDGATFEALRGTAPERGVRRRIRYEQFELLNFGVPGYYPPQQLVSLRESAGVQPNAVFYIATGREQDRSAFYLAEVVRKSIEIPYPRAARYRRAVRRSMPR